MYPYVAFLRKIGASHNDSYQTMVNEFRHAHPTWTLSQGGDGLAVFHSSPRGRSVDAIELPEGRGLILGTLFPKDLETSPRHWHFVVDDRLAEKMVSTRGRVLVDDYWGAYIAFLNLRGRAHIVLRDSSGKIPCYVIGHGDCTVLASDILDLTGLEPPAFSINTRYLAGFIYHAELSQRECGLNEVTELLAGECIEWSRAGARRHSVWNPRSICREDSVELFQDACSQVRRVTQACVDFWASKYDRIVHKLSGGLDSSAILGCLRRSAYCPHVTCLHLESGGADDNDRAFAELAAKQAGIELVIQPGYSQHARYDERVFRLPRAPKPSVANLGITLEQDPQNSIPRRVRAEAIWDGQGGDHLFFEPRSPFGAVDYAFRHGIAGDYSRYVRDAVIHSKMSYWGVLGKSLRLGLLRGRWKPEDEYRRKAFLLNPDIVPADIVDYVWQPWQSESSDLPPGKRWQICLLACLIHRHRPVHELQYASEHHPLFSQPLVELCLRIPLYTLLKGGIDRSLERVAFRDCVPEAIIRREDKGTVSITVMSKIRECLPFIRELMLDGVLAKERIIERSAIEPYLAGNRPMNGEVLWPFLSCMAAEVWARNWATTSWRL